MAEKVPQNKQTAKPGSSNGPRKYPEKVRLSDRGNLTILRTMLLRVKDRVAKEGTTLESESMVAIGGKRPATKEPDPPKPTNPFELEAASILRAQRDEQCRLAIAVFKSEQEQYNNEIIPWLEAHALFLRENPDATEEEIKDEVGDEPVLPTLKFPEDKVPDVRAEYEEMAKTKYELELKAAREDAKNLRKDEAKAISFIRQALADEYVNEMMAVIPSYKRVEESKDLVKYIDMLVIFHLTTSKEQGITPESALDQLVKHWANMSQGREESLTHWKERIVDQDRAIVILGTHVRSQEGERDDEHKAHDLPPIEPKSEKDKVRKFINHLSEKYSFFREEYTRSKRAYPATLEDAHAEAERYGPNDLKRTHTPTVERVYATQARKFSLKDKCTFCDGTYHVVDVCRYKLQGLTKEEAIKQRKADAEKSRQERQAKRQAN
jgi:hypothetical protein